MLDFENDEPIVHFDILTVQDGDTRRTEIRMPLADYLALVKRSHSLDELRTLILCWTPAKTRSASA